MQALSFTFESSNIRTLGTPALPLFVALDVCSALGHTNPRKAIKDHVDDEDIVKQEIVDTMNRTQTVNCVNESGLYALIFGSKLESAKRFKKWVTSEVLPAIRKNGMYEHYVPAYLSDEQCWTIQSEVGKKAKGQGRHFQTIYRALKNHFKVPKYTHILAKDFDEAVRFIRELDFSVPVRFQADEAEEPPAIHHHVDLEVGEKCPCCGLQKIPENAIFISDKEARLFLNVVYVTKYLFREQYEDFANFLASVHSPMAGRFYDAFNDLTLGLLEQALARHGYRVENLSAYQHLIAATR